ncbi:unnamed protein product [Allacma fusca]|uniref:TOM1-like protein 2 n=1 Tax=Allacma fusca TaxID=39272 RepID=A0A8J2LK92_9HEXA|nr:unnamed protein product [Allacma fusca]
MEAAKKPLDDILSFFAGNPFATPVGQKIEQATDSSLASENWGLNMEICDMINMSEDGAKDAARAIHKRLKQNAGKNYTIIMYTLTVLETCVKNCGKKLHILVCHKDFIQNLVNLIGPKNDPPAVVQEKILGLIQSWADTFQDQAELSGVVQVYHDLKSKGIEFPMTDLDAMAPILTPKRSVEAEPILHPVDLGERQTKVTPDQVSKIRRDLDVVQSNMAVFSEMLSEMKPGNENVNDVELLEELFATCKEMQRRIAELLCSIISDELTGEMLHINDELNNLFLRYGRYKKNQEKTQQKPSEPSLIDFGGEGDLSRKLGVLSVANSKPNDDADFDSFAQSRTDKVAKPSAKPEGGNIEEEILMGHKISDFDEMEAWLRENPVAPAAYTSGTSESTLTSSEFDKFLADRAAAAVNSGNISSEGQGGESSSNPQITL